MSGRTDPFRRFCRFAAGAFALVVLYTLIVKLPSGELADDWLHTALHVATGAGLAFAGWRARSETVARAGTFGILLGYGFLGVFGWFVEGIALDSPLRIPLDAGDNGFHLALALAAAGPVAAPVRRRVVPVNEAA